MFKSQNRLLSELFDFQSLYFNILRDFNKFRISPGIYYPTPRLDIVFFQLIVINDLRLWNINNLYLKNYQNFLNILTSLVIYIGKYLYRTNYDKNQNTLHNPVCSYWPKFPFPCRINLQRKAYLSCHF